MAKKTTEPENDRKYSKTNRGVAVMKFSSIKEVEEALDNYVPDLGVYVKEGLSLDRMWPLLEIAGNPQKKLKVIHLAGTSGKTSTAYYISALLLNSGNKVGLTVSPHLSSLTERLQINSEPLGDGEFCDEFGEFMELVEKVDSKPRYFELLIIFVLWVFVRKNVDYAVVETGLGGLLDGSNVVTRKDKICVITDIGIDHENILGNSVGEIAAKKAGIIHSGNKVYIYQQDDEAMEPIKDRINEKKATLYPLSFEVLLANYKGDLSKIPSFQKRNWLLANSVVMAVAKRDNLKESNMLDPLSIVIPGRMETVTLSDGSTLIMDGAHNKQKMQAFVSSFKELYPERKADVLLALKEGKEYKSVINSLAEITEKLLVTTFKTTQDLPHTSHNPRIIANYAKEQGLEVSIVEDNQEAYKKLIMKDKKMKIITGSLYLLGQIRKNV